MSSIKLKGSSSGDVTITVPAAAGTNTVTIPAATGNLPLSNLTHVTNRPNTKPLVINGDMHVAQRSTSVTGVTSPAYVTVDRFHCNISTMGTWTVTQADDAPTGSGFQHSLKLDCTTADASPAAGDNITISTRLEGQDVQLFKKGTSSAEKFTVSFYVKSTKTGTHILELDDNDNGRNINQAYTISSSNTWEKKVLTFDADTTGAFGNDNGSSLRLFWWVGAGSTFSSGTLETSWASTTNANRAVGQVNNADSTDNNWQITGVQLEVGEYTADTIPPFQHESFGDNLSRCRRYFESTEPSSNRRICGFQTASSGQKCLPVDFKTSKRANPTMIIFDEANASGKLSTLNLGGTATNGATVALVLAYVDCVTVFSNNGTNAGISFQYTADAEL